MAHPQSDPKWGLAPALVTLGGGLTPNDLVRASEDQLTHKAVSRAMAGRWLTPNMQDKVRRALERASNSKYALSELFSYAGSSPPT